MKIVRWIGLAAAALLLFMGCFYRNAAKEILPCVILRSQEEGFSVKNFLSDSETETPYTFTLWEQQDDVSISSVILGKTAQADLLKIYGQSRLLLPYGKNLLRQDTEGCLIGAALAKDLFGSEQAEGQQLLADNRILTVRGVVQTPEQIIICETDTAGASYTPDHISIAMPDDKDAASLAAAFMSYYGISSTAVRYDYYLNPLPLWELVPGKWSDFAGWKDKIAAYQKALWLLETTPKSCIEELYLQKIRSSYLYLFFGTVLGIGVLLRRRT